MFSDRSELRIVREMDDRPLAVFRFVVNDGKGSVDMPTEPDLGSVGALSGTELVVDIDPATGSNCGP